MMMKSIRPLLSAYSSIFYLNNPWVGAGFLLTSCLYPNIALGGLLALIYVVAILAFVKIPWTHPLAITLGYNGLLVGLFTGYLFQLNFVLIFFLLLLVLLCFLITAGVESFLRAYALPVLAIPFMLLAIVLTLMAPTLTHFIDLSPYWIEKGRWVYEYLPSWGAQFFRSVGSILCLPDPLAGVLIWFILLLASPLMAMGWAAGFALGYGVELLLRWQLHFPLPLHYFNYSVLFSGLGFVFIFPSRHSLFWATLATLVTPLVVVAAQAFWQPYHVPITAMPFNLMMLLVLQTLMVWKPNLIFRHYQQTPEHTIDRARLFRWRFGNGVPAIFCPVDGFWQVQQGFNGAFTHRGSWQHALDLVAVDSQGQIFKNSGFDLSDYYTFGQPVRAPISGYVVALNAGLPDNPIGRVDHQHNFGNYLIIRSPSGPCVTLAHLKGHSITVALHAYVEAGQKVAECGNSGYSQTPHLHLQAQWSPLVGAATTRFKLMNYQQGEQIEFYGVPAEGATIRSLPLYQELDRALTFKIGDQLKFQHGSQIQIIEVALDELTGSLYLFERLSGAKISFAKAGAQFYFYDYHGPLNSILADLYRVAPKIPLTYDMAASFEDWHPLTFVTKWPWRWVRLVSYLLFSQRRSWAERYDYNAHQLILRRPSVGLLRLDPYLGLIEFQVQQRFYRRVTT